MLTAEQIEKNWEQFLTKLKSCTTGDRQAKILAFYVKYDERFATMPASVNTAYHNAFAGGYIDHVLRVANCAYDLCKLWDNRGACVEDFEDNELLFVALNHDLGKFGDDKNEYFINQDSDWHAKRGEIFKHNPALQYMNVQDRTLYILQSLGIELSQNEYLTIKLHDGLYDEGNKSYYVTYNSDKRLRSNMPYILHQADLMASRIEFDLSHSKTSVVSHKEFSEVTKPIKVKSKSKYTDLLNKL